MATLINGNGNNAVYAQQDADLYAGALGESTRILNVGSKLAYTIEDANTIAVADGVILTKEGRRIQVDVGSVDEFTIPTGAAGVTRYYIIGYHLYTDGSANQKCETFVQLMASESETIPEAEFREGATEVYVSLYRIKQIGLNLDTITALLSVGIALTDMTDVIGDTDISGIGDGTLTGGLNAVNQNLTELEEAAIHPDAYELSLPNYTPTGSWAVVTSYTAPSDGIYIFTVKAKTTNNNFSLYVTTNWGSSTGLVQYSLPPFQAYTGYESYGRTLTAVLKLEAGQSLTILAAMWSTISTIPIDFIVKKISNS